MEKPKFELQLKNFSLNDGRALEEFQKAVQAAKALGYQKVDLKFKAFGTAEKVVPEGQMNLFEEE